MDLFRPFVSRLRHTRVMIYNSLAECPIPDMSDMHLPLNDYHLVFKIETITLLTNSTAFINVENNHDSNKLKTVLNSIKLIEKSLYLIRIFLCLPFFFKLFSVIVLTLSNCIVMAGQYGLLATTKFLKEYILLS